MSFRIFIRYIFILGTCLIAALFGALFYAAKQPWVDFAVLEYYNPSKPSVLLDDEGNEWARFQLDRRDVIPLSSMPKHLIQAFVAAEDHQFYQHPGISIRAIIRSVVVNLFHGRIVQGASTITQQLVKLLFFDLERSFKRKIKEQAFALVVEQQFTKDQIMYIYLNHIYFGAGIYGVEAASQRFWGKQAADLTVDEAAVLASIVRSPRMYCPLYNPEATRMRRNSVLHSMTQLGYLSQGQCTHLRSLPLSIIKYDQEKAVAYAKEYVRQLLEELLGKQKLYAGGLRIQTTINRHAQNQAHSVFQEHLKNFRHTICPTINGALITLEGSTGGIKALIGGYDFQYSPFNRAIKAQRQMGSTIKPVIYAAALESGRLFSDIALDEPLTIIDHQRQWEPQNSYKTFEGPMTLAYALSRSNNIIAIKTLLEVGFTPVIGLAQQLGITADIKPYPSLALGCIDAPLVDVVALINTFAQHGTYYKPHIIEWIKDEWGTKIESFSEKHRQVLRASCADQVAHVLTLTMEAARATHILWPRSQALGKTGTTNDARTCWFIGATPRYTTGVYIGRDDNAPLGAQVYASQTVLPLWGEYMYYLDTKGDGFSFDSTYEIITIDKYTGKTLVAGDQQGITILRKK